MRCDPSTTLTFICDLCFFSSWPSDVSPSWRDPFTLTLTCDLCFFSSWTSDMWPLYLDLDMWSFFSAHNLMWRVISLFWPRRMISIFSAPDVVACDPSTLTLTCPNISEIVIDSAIFGHYDHQYCGNSLSTTNCHQQGDFAIVDNLCTGKETCDVDVNGNTFGGDPCPGTAKYLHVHYRCVSK